MRTRQYSRLVSVRDVDVEQALGDLTEVSSQVEAAVVFDAAGNVAGSTLAGDGRAEELARHARALVDAAETVRRDSPPLRQLAALTESGAAFVVRQGDRLIAATTAPSPTVALVFYDLHTCLENLEGARDVEGS